MHLYDMCLFIQGMRNEGGEWSENDGSSDIVFLGSLENVRGETKFKITEI